ncbi:MAG: SCO1664 family protein [Acidimicrobiales bacterium]|nr:SCO1664 family protein [Acidimicrobiales bacterium]
MAHDDDAIAEALRHGEVEVLGRMPWSSNGTFLCQVRCSDQERRAIYKPRRAERPLWDFPSGLDQREVAAYELSRALGWDVVPVTVRRDGPLGLGSLQDFIEADFEQHYFTLYEDEATHPALRTMCVLDLVGNNTDRKSGHCLLGLDGRIRGIDHGLMFHHEFKLRTVIWEFGGEDIPDPLLEDLNELLAAGLPDDLAELLDPFERDAVLTRARAVLDAGRFPIDETGRRYPWPLV